MKIRVALALLFSMAVVAFSQSGGWVRYFQLYSGDRSGNGAKIQMATGTPAAGAVAVYDANGNVAPKLVGTEGQVLTVVSGAPDYATPASAVSIPAGAVMSFNLTSCPSGWSDYTAASGRYIVGLPSGGTLAGTTGTALTNAENRVVGQHNHMATVDSHAHAITDSGHTHDYGGLAITTVQSGTGASSVTASGIGVTSSEVAGITSTELTQPGATVANSGSVAGTNAPYIQLRMCSKN